MTVIYWTGAAVALVSAIGAAVEFARDRSSAVAGWALSMLIVSASLAAMAVVPAVLEGRPEPAASAGAALGIVGTWAFAEVLATGPGDARRVAGMMTIPFLAGTGALLLLLGLHWAASHGTADAGFSQAMGIMAQLTVMVYYLPGLCRIAGLARRRARSIPASWARATMLVLCASAGLEAVLVMARSAVLAAQAAGLRAEEPVITTIGVLQGVVAAGGAAALAAGPVVMLISARCARWLAHPADVVTSPARPR